MSVSCYRRFANIWTFLIIFCLCFFLETITFTYLITAIQSIERQFQIPSRMSGALVSSSDIGYVLFVVLLSYFGSRGNRARWIGGGCLLISMACLVIALPHFIFKDQPIIDSKGLLVKEAYEENLPPWIHDKNMTVRQLFDFPPIKKLPIPDFIKIALIEKDEGTEKPDPFMDWITGDYNYDEDEKVEEEMEEGIEDEEEDYYEAYDEDGNPKSAVKRRVKRSRKMSPEMAKMLAEFKAENNERKAMMRELVGDVMADARPIQDLKEGVLLKEILPMDYNVFENPLPKDPQAVRSMILKQPHQFILMRIQRGAGLPFGTCNKIVNTLRSKITALKCEQKSSNTAAYGIVFVGIMMIGIGHSMPWTLGVPLIDDNVKKQSTPLYFAGVFFIRILGPVLGFVIGGACTRMYFNFDPPTGLTPLDPRWIGAWWLGFLIIFGVLLIPSVLLFCFPSGDDALQESQSQQTQQTNGQQKLINGHSSEKGADYGGAESQVKQENGKRVLYLTDKHRNDEEDLPVKEAFLKFLSALWIVIKNPIYSGCILGRFFDTFAFKGLFVFLPKYLEMHYGVPQFKANMYLAIMGVAGFACGVAIGSVAMKKLKLEGRKAALYVFLVSATGVALSFANLGLGCTSVVNKVGTQGLENDFNFNTGCNGHCSCDSVPLYPVCDQSGKAYFSPCTAGCQNMTIIDKMSFKFEFNECGCIDEGSKVSRDLCHDDCGSMLTVYFVLSVIGGLIGGTAVIPSIMIVLRSVPPQHRSVALGFSGFAMSLFSTLPSPIVYGLLVDSACLLWNTDCVDSQGSCIMYDPNQLRLRMYGFNGALRVCGLLFDVWVLYWAKDLRLMDGVEEQEEQEAAKADGKKALSEMASKTMGSISSLNR